MVEQSELQAMNNDELLSNYWNYKNAVPQIVALGKDPARVQAQVDLCKAEMDTRGLTEATSYTAYVIGDNGSKVYYAVDFIDELNRI